MSRILIDGKMVELPDSADPGDILRKMGEDPSKRVLTKKTTAGNTRLKPGKKYAFKQGNKFSIGPARIKASGMFTYFGNKESWRKQLITEQVTDVSKKMFRNHPVELDDDCNWVKFHGFLLPTEWQRANPGKSFVPMMIIFPDQYPDLPTNGFYLPSSLNVPQNAGHFFSRGFGGAFGDTEDEMRAMADKNWNWYCTHIVPEAWRPAKIRQVSDWRNGDNLWDIITICKDVLTHPLDD